MKLTASSPTALFKAVMKYREASRLISLLPLDKDQALSVTEIGRKFFKLGHNQTLSTKQKRRMQNYLLELSSSTSVTELDIPAPAAVERFLVGRTYRYYALKTHLALWQMSPETAVNLLLTQNLMAHTLGKSGSLASHGTLEVAQEVTNASPTLRRFRKRVRVVADGLGREPIDFPTINLANAIRAIEENRQISMDYEKPTGQVVSRICSIQGLVAKDGAIYLLGTHSFDDPPKHYALHRARNLQVLPDPAITQDHFDLDRYIQQTGQLSHGLGEGLIELVLRVAPETFWHFKERPLTAEQTYTDPSGTDPWYRVTAHLPHTYLLVPWLLSMGGWIEVLGPPAVRAEMKARLDTAAAHYV